MNRLLWVGLCASFLTSGEVLAQAVTLDEGTFVVEIYGRRAGTETFTLRRAGFGANARIIAQGTLELQADGDRSALRMALQTEGTEMDIRAYQVDVTGSGALRLRMSRTGDRFRAEIESEAGIQEREFRAEVGSRPVVLLDRWVAHQYYFLARMTRASEREISVISPRPGYQRLGTLTSEGVETITIGNQTVQAERLTLRVNGEEHRIWLDDQHRVLRVEVPAIGFRASRRELPGS
jgi:hypothetical protein